MNNLPNRGVGELGSVLTFCTSTTAIFKPDISGQMSEITLSEDLQAALAQFDLKR
jgi:hypothetical protein